MKTKGTNWLAMKSYLCETYSPEQIAMLKAKLDDNSKQLFDDLTIVPISWVDYSVYMNILLTADRILGTNDFEVVRKANHYCAHKDIRGVYRLLVSLISPKTAINALGKLLSRYYDCGQLTVANLKSNSATIIIEEVPDIPLHHGIEMGSYVEEVLHMSGAKSTKITHPECMALGDPRCRFEAKWS